MQIGTVAKRIGVSVDAIRFYERSDLLPVAPRTAGGFRQYGNGDVETLLFIRRAQGLDELAVELAPKNIRVNSLGPTFLETPMTKPFFENKAFRDEVLGKIKLGRLGQLEELTGAIVRAAEEVVGKPVPDFLLATEASNV